MIATACTQTITLLYIYLCVWKLDFRLNNVNYSYWYFLSSIIITFLYWTSRTLFSSNITTSEYLICDTEAKSLQDELKDVWTLLNDLGFSLCAALPICYVVTTSDNKKKSKMEVRANLVCYCQTPEIEFNKSLSLSIIKLANYSVTTSLIYRYLL